MDPNIEKAIKESIQKWEKILAETDVDLGAKNCPLCELFTGVKSNAYIYLFDNCPMDTTPVQNESYSVYCNGCVGTPYNDWYQHHTSKHPHPVRGTEFPMKIECDTCIDLAKKELEYIKDKFIELKDEE